MWILAKNDTTTATLIFPATASCQTTATLIFPTLANCWMSVLFFLFVFRATYSPLTFLHSGLSILPLVLLGLPLSFFCLECL